MPWCPSCNTEYEAHIEECADCHIPLISDEAYQEEEKFELIGYVPQFPKSIHKEVIKYLKYSNIDPIRQVADQENIGLYVHKSQKKDAMKFLKVYMSQKIAESREEQQEEPMQPEYETIDVNSGAKVKEMKASGFSFCLIGGILAGFSTLNLLGIMDVISRGIYLYVFMVLGIAAIIVGILSYRRLPKLIEEDQKLQAHLEEMKQWFESNYTKKSYLTKKKIKLSAHDEGTLYFVVMDKLKKDLQRAFKEDPEVLINSGCEVIFETYFNVEES